MIHVVVAVFDEAAGIFGRPVFAVSIGAAIRSFADEVNREAGDNAMFNHASDFNMFHLGEFDDITGEFRLLGKPNRIAVGADLRT